MNISLLLILALPVFYLAYRYYGGFISKVFGEDDSIPTPSLTMTDGVDYVPTKLGVVFSHHFASIAGAGPIIGPTAAVIFGYMPVWFWVIIGTVFIGAVQDYTALFMSLREKGRSIAEVADRSLGRFGFILFISFTIVMLLLVTSAFLGLTATALTSLVPLKSMGITEGQTILKTVTGADGVVKAQIGGIASTSVIFMTLCAPVIGFLLYKRGISVLFAGALATIVGIISITIGVYYPLTLDPKVWMMILTVYVIFAAGIPVWIVLQPRDFTNSFLLYIGMAALFVGVIGGGFSGLTMQIPAYNVAAGTKAIGMLWPFLFITVACGAISGFHTLVAGGTISKQVSKESDARKIGYGGMILEALLALLVIVAVAGGLNFETYSSIVYPTTKGVASNPILAFSLGMGTLMHNSIGIPITAGTVLGILMVEGFVVTTLDTAVRLNRYLFEELWATLLKDPPAILKSYIFNACLSAGLMFWLGYTNTFSYIWPIFGTANQLLAALALIAVAVWLAYRKKPNLFAVLPAVFMMVTTLASLWQLLFNKYLPTKNYPLAVTDILLMLLSLGVIILAVQKLVSVNKVSAADLTK